jgi:hypothetical protein
MSRHRYPICPATGKVRFRERKDVKLALRQADRHRSSARLNEVDCRRRETHGYMCSDCDGWHLTSQTVRLVTAVPASPVAGLAARALGPAAEAMRRMATATGLAAAGAAA